MMALCIVCGGPTVDGTGGPCSMECLKTAQRATIAMTQPVSPEDAVKALMWRCPHLTHEPSGICLGCGEQHEPLQSWLDTQNTRTPPPSALDDEVAAMAAAMLPIFAELDNGSNGPGHGHRLPGVWDDDISNGANAGKPCDWCAQWSHARALLTRLKDCSK